MPKFIINFIIPGTFEVTATDEADACLLFEESKNAGELLVAGDITPAKFVSVKEVES